MPFGRTFQAELRKMVDTRAGMWMLTVMAAVSFIIAGIFLIWGTGTGDQPHPTSQGCS